MNSKNETVVHFRKRMIKLVSLELPDTLDVDELCRIDYSNLFGEALTIPVALNKLGNLMSEAESEYEKQKIRTKIEESNLSKNFRRNWVSTEEKFTEKKLEEKVHSDPKYKQIKYDEIEAQKNFGFISNLFWALKSKDEKLNVLMKGIKPEDFEKELVEGVVNTYMIRIHEKKYS